MLVLVLVLVLLVLVLELEVEQALVVTALVVAWTVAPRMIGFVTDFAHAL